MITENLSTLKIHKLTQEQYDRELAAGNIDASALYLTPDEDDVVYFEDYNSDIVTSPLNADTLGGRLPEEFALVATTDNLQNQIDNVADNMSDMATESFVKNAIAQAQLDGGDVDLSGYATKDDLATKAPAGYGLGETARTMQPEDTDEWCGFITTNDAGIVDDTYGYWGWQVRQNTYGTQFMATIENSMAMRNMMSGNWNQWEYLNPRLHPNSEYRTTERINGKAVYKRLVNGVIQYRLEDEDTWKNYSTVLGARPNTWMPTASDVGALPISGGNLTGELKVNKDTTNGIRLWTDNEGGNLRIYPPADNTYTNYWDIDCYDGGMRIFANKKDTNPNGAGHAFSLTLGTDGAIKVGNNAKTRQNLGITPANIGAAPSGYGYGELPLALGSATNDTTFLASLNEAFANTSGKTRLVTFTKDSVTYLGTLWNSSDTDGYGVLTAVCYHGTDSAHLTKIVRNHKNGTWDAWEYENPPLKNNTEYRTTERDAGKPVYIKRVNLGALPNKNNKRQVIVPTGVTIVSIDGYSVYTSSAGNEIYTPLVNTEGVTSFFVNKTTGQVGINTDTDLSTYTATVTVKYTK